MYDFFKDSPALRWMEADARADEQRKADQRVREMQRKAQQQLRENERKAQQQLLERDKKAQRQVLEEPKKTQLQLREKDRQTLSTLREMVIAMVAQRFPALKRLARAQVRALNEPELFQQAILRLSLAQNVDDAQDALFSLSENEGEEEAN